MKIPALILALTLSLANAAAEEPGSYYRVGTATTALWDGYTYREAMLATLPTEIRIDAAAFYLTDREGVTATFRHSGFRSTRNSYTATSTAVAVDPAGQLCEISIAPTLGGVCITISYVDQRILRCYCSVS